jgi:tetratricopeptide (TPR) repeat protein
VASPVDSWLRAGVAAAQAGDLHEARGWLLRVVQADGENVQAWYWLSLVVERPHEREICLENVLALDPGHTAVQAELAALRRERAEAEAALLSKEAIAAAVPRTSQEALIADAAVEPLACPSCGALTAAEDRQCAACGCDLWLRKPKSRDHSFYSLGLVVLWFGLANYLWLGLAGYYLFTDLASAAEASPGMGNTLAALARFLGIDTGVLPQLDVPLTPVLLAGGLAFAFSLLVAWGLYRRLRGFYWLTVALILAGFLYQVYQVAAAGTVSLWRLAGIAGSFLLTVGFAFMAYDEFTWVEERISAEVDRDVDSPSSLYARGRQCADKGLWAKAAAHWAKAVALSPGHPDYRLALASAYIQLGRPERAREHLAAAQRIEPQHPQLAELLATLET